MKTAIEKVKNEHRSPLVEKNIKREKAAVLLDHAYERFTGNPSAFNWRELESAMEKYQQALKGE